MGKHHAMERVEVRLHPFLTSAEDTLIFQWERCSWYERSCKEKKIIFHFVSVAQLTDCRYLLDDRLGRPLCPSCKSEEIFP
jgi:predicted Zn-ribbon and HTH transcriptional regulator